MRLIPIIVIAVVSGVMTSCGEDKSETPYMRFLGGGFVFNYRIGTAYYGFVVKAQRRLPSNAVLEARFENPSGGPALIVTKEAVRGRIDYAFRSPPVTGVKANKPYKVELRILDAKRQRILGTLSRTFRSSADQDVMPRVIHRTQ